MEDILAIILVLAGVALSILAAKRIYAYIHKRICDHIQQKRDAERAETERQIEATRKWRESLRSKTVATAVSNKPPAKKVPSADKVPTTTTTTYTTADDSFLSDVATMLVLNAALKNDSAQASVNYNTNEVRITTSNDITSSDDSYTKPSWSSWSSSSSDSSSSWSSSSSDSGPSSDW